jgi:hypothetical protein
LKGFNDLIDQLESKANGENVPREMTLCFGEWIIVALAVSAFAFFIFLKLTKRL